MYQKTFQTYLIIDSDAIKINQIKSKFKKILKSLNQTEFKKFKK